MKVGVTIGTDGLEPATTGVHPCVLCEVADLGIDEHPKYGRRHQGVMVFQVAETGEVEFNNNKETRRKEVRFYFDIDRGLGVLNSSRGGTKLRKLLEGWQGREFSLEQLREFMPAENGGGGKLLDLDKLVGKPGQLMVSVEKGVESGREFAKFVRMMPPDKDEANRIGLSSDFPYTPLAERVGNDDSSGTSSASEPAAPSADDDDVPWALGL